MIAAVEVIPPARLALALAPLAAALAVFWWSHVPLGRIGDFLSTLHAKLAPGAVVLFADELPYDRYPTRTDADGNHLELRTLPDGRTW